jgi:hypothetical protein
MLLTCFGQQSCDHEALHLSHASHILVAAE